LNRPLGDSEKERKNLVDLIPGRIVGEGKSFPAVSGGGAKFVDQWVSWGPPVTYSSLSARKRAEQRWGVGDISRSASFAQ